MKQGRYDTAKRQGRSVDALTELYEWPALYRSIYTGRDRRYRRECELVLERVRAVNPSIESVLDIACGPGDHLLEFSHLVAESWGIDRYDAMVREAKRTAPDATVRLGDMRNFDLGRTFDCVVCLFSSIGYTRTVTELASAIAMVGKHLSPRGVAHIEPWWDPDRFLDGYVSTDSVNHGTKSGFVRLSHSMMEHDAAGQARTVMTVHYAGASTEGGPWHFSDTHELSLFTHEQYLAAFEQAGLHADFLDIEGTPGVFVASHHDLLSR